jgi:hypothetical protein
LFDFWRGELIVADIGGRLSDQFKEDTGEILKKLIKDSVCFQGLSLIITYELF